MARTRAAVFVLVFILLPGCAGSLRYVRPPAPTPSENSKVIDKPRDAVWDSALVSLSKHFFVITTLDRTSGYIGVSYSGEPRDYVDCGRLVTVTTPPWRRKHSLGEPRRAPKDQPPSGAHDVPAASVGMSLEGRINLVLESLAQDRTRVTVTIVYALSRSEIADVYRSTFQTHDTITLASAGRTAFPPDGSGQVIECVPTGRLEREVLDLIR